MKYGLQIMINGKRKKPKMKTKIPSGSKRDKTGPTKKQNKYKDPFYARKVYFLLSKGIHQHSAGYTINQRRNIKW